jgi:hypothetical protein
MYIIDSVFQPVIGKICWNVKNGFGSSLTFEFGEPHFEVVREPRVTKSKRPRGIRHAARRIVAIHGDWFLWIWDCDWRFYRNKVFVGDSESKKKDLKQIAFDLEGQALLSVKVNGEGISVFEFDLGGRLETLPYSEANEESKPDEQWLFYQPSGMVFTLRSDGKYNNSMGNQPTTDEWFPLESNSK